jgi:hypothetical protein
MSGGPTASDWAALAEVAKEESSSRGGMHREVNVLGLEDVGVWSPSSLVPDVRIGGLQWRRLRRRPLFGGCVKSS